MALLSGILKRGNTGLYLLLFLLALVPQSSKAQAPTDTLRFRSTELMYRWLGGTRYEVIFKAFHYNVGNYYLPDSVKACYTNLCTGNSTPFKLGRIIGQLPLYAGGTDTNNAAVVRAGCNGFGNAGGVHELWYRGYVTLPAGCSDWRFSVFYQRRDSSTTPQWPGHNNVMYTNKGGYIEAYLHQQGTSAAPVGNSSVFLTVKPDNGMLRTEPWAAGTPHYSVALGAIDPENDSLVFGIVQPRSPVAGRLVQRSGYSFQRPLFQPSDLPLQYRR